jgi:hypothetical protein
MKIFFALVFLQKFLNFECGPTGFHYTLKTDPHENQLTGFVDIHENQSILIAF